MAESHRFPTVFILGMLLLSTEERELKHGWRKKLNG